MVIGNIGFDLMAPLLKKHRIETVLVSIADGNLNTSLADKVFVFPEAGQWMPLVELAVSEQVDCVISISGPDRLNLRDSLVKETLEKEHGVPVLANPLSAVRVAVDKAATKSWLRARGLPVTTGSLARTVAEAKRLAKDFGYPLVVKLPDHSGGVGMRIIKSPAEFARRLPVKLPVLIEKFVSGPEFSVEVLNHNGQALPLSPVYKGMTDPEGIHPMERVKLAPAPLDAPDVAHLRNLAKRIVVALDLQPTADIDFVWGPDGPQVLEINPRFGGVTALSMAASGVPVYEALVDMALGSWDPARYRLKRRFAADMPINSEIAADKIDQLLRVEGIFRIKLQRLKKTTARVALRAENPERLLRIARHAAHLCGCNQDCYKELKRLVSQN